MAGEQKVDQAAARLAAFDEFMKDYRKNMWQFYANPNLPNEAKYQMDEVIREVFYAGYAAGAGANVLAALTGRKTP